MGRKLNAAKASLVAAFLAAGGAATARAVHAAPARPANTIGGVSVNWGDQLVRFLKLDGFPAYLKADGFEALTQFYKEVLLSDASTLYAKYGGTVSDVLSLYQKADGGPLAGILSGLEQFYKDDNLQPLLNDLKQPGAMDAFDKWDKWFTALQAVGEADQQAGAPSALDYYIKLTGIQGDPLQQITNSGAPS
ncbi:MAG TPA: hypothetical protein VNC40_04425 [Gaiellaceae bacterium]|nr:hypothetical protein [Gaiellaceae bacterium]